MDRRRLFPFEGNRKHNPTPNQGDSRLVHQRKYSDCACELGVPIPGAGAVSGTFMAGVEAGQTVEWMQGEDLITHLGLEYHD